MNVELYDRILTLMAIDSGYEKDFGYRYVNQNVFDEALLKANVGSPDMDYIRSRVEIVMDELTKEIS